MSDSSEISFNGIRVLIVDLSKRFGGASTRAISLAHQLGPKNAAIAGIEGSPVLQFAKEKGVPVKVVGKYRADPLIPFRLSALIKKEGYNVIDTQNIQSKFWGSFASLLSKAALVSTLNSYYESEHGGNLKGKVYTALELGTNFSLGHYVVVSDAIRKSLAGAGVPEERIDLIRNAVVVDDSDPDESPAAIREKFGLPQDSILCMAVGRLVWAKGYDDFIQAFALLSEQVKNAYAVIIGDGVLRPELVEQINKAGLEKKIILAGFYDHDAVLSMIKSCDIYVMPSKSEGIPFALLEAAAVGLPIVATNCGGIPEVLTDNVNGLLVPVSDPPSLASAIKKLCVDRQFAAQLGFKARETIRESYSIPVLLEATRNAYVKALRHRKLPYS